MKEVMYKPEDAGSYVINSRGKSVKIRKYHMSKADVGRVKGRWEKEIVGVSRNIIKKAGGHFFNPYRKGIYHYQIQSMFLLGANKWHNLSTIMEKMKEVMSSIPVIDNSVLTNAWEQFRGKRGRENATRCKDYIGRIQENMIFFQRLTKLHPCGYKLRQVYSAVDIKVVSKVGFENGLYYYRLSTYDTFKEALPIRDYKDFKFINDENKYLSNKFVGTIITKDKTLFKGSII